MKPEAERAGAHLKGSGRSRRALVGLLLVVPMVLWVLASPASAVTATTPDQYGADAYGNAGWCNVNFQQVSISGAPTSFGMAMKGSAVCNISAFEQQRLWNGAPWNGSGATPPSFPTSTGAVPWDSVGGIMNYTGNWPAGTYPNGISTCAQYGGAHDQITITSNQVIQIDFCFWFYDSSGSTPNAYEWNTGTYTEGSVGVHNENTQGGSGCNSAPAHYCDNSLFFIGGYDYLYVLAIWNQPGVPQQPSPYFTGGTTGLPTVPVPPACTLTRELQSPTGNMNATGGQGLANFTLTTQAVTAGAVQSISLDSGDGSAAGSVTVDSNFKGYPSHFYSGPEPSNGWTAVATVTWTGDNNTYKGTAQTTCAVRLDWNYPGNSKPGSTGAGPPTGSAASCPSGWGWLDPGNFGDILTCLFVPSGLPSDFSNIQSHMQSTWIGMPTSVLGVVSNAWSTWHQYATQPCDTAPGVPTNSNGTNGCASGVTIHMPLVDKTVQIDPAQGVAVGGQGASAQAIYGSIKTTLTFAVYILGGIGGLRLALSILGYDWKAGLGGGDSGSGDE